MHDNIFGISNSGIQFAFRFGVYLIIALLLALIAIRLVFTLVCNTRAKARKQWDMQQVAEDNKSFLARFLNSNGQGSDSEKYLNDDVRLMLEQSGKRPAVVDRGASGQPVL
jgi:hypothetical protein